MINRDGAIPLPGINCLLFLMILSANAVLFAGQVPPELEIIGQRLQQLDQQVEDLFQLLGDENSGISASTLNQNHRLDLMLRQLLSLEGRLEQIDDQSVESLKKRARAIKYKIQRLRNGFALGLIVSPVDSGNNSNARVAGSSGISGQVTAAKSGMALDHIEINVWDHLGNSRGRTHTKDMGNWSIERLPAGSYFVTTWNDQGLIDGLYQDILCPGGAFSGCNPVLGTPVQVEDGMTASGIDFSLESGGTITGRLREAGSELAIPSARVDVWNERGDFIERGFTDRAGRYSVPGLASGNYFVTTAALEFHNMLFDGIPCPGGGFSGCDPVQGSPVPVLLNTTTTGIDFLLERLGSISGVLTDSTSGGPIPFENITVWDQQGNHVVDAGTDINGQYIAGGLEPGVYFITTDVHGFLDELYDDIPCYGSGHPGCDPVTGDSVPVSLNTRTTGIDFTLNKPGSITGILTSELTSESIVSERVMLWNNEGFFVRNAHTDDNGVYLFDGLTSGDYFVTTNTFEFIDELYDNIPCNGQGHIVGCDPTTGTPIAVMDNVVSDGIDIALTALGSISGTLTDSVNSEPIESVVVRVWDKQGDNAGYGHTDSNGLYFIGGLVPGDYFVTTDSALYADKLYDNLPCNGPDNPGCDPATGAPITVTLNNITEGIDFVLDRLGVISGRLSQSVTGDPVDRSEVIVWNAQGVFAGNDATGQDGVYEIGGLVPDNYFVTTNASGFANELYNNLPCTGSGNPGCDPTAGTPVGVILNTITDGINFELDRLGSISGVLTDSETGDHLGFEHIDVWDEQGSLIGHDRTDRDGIYVTAGLEPGNYFVTTNTSTHVDELYDNLPCAGPDSPGCDLLTGSPVTVALNTNTENIDFSLVRLGSISGILTDAVTGEPLNDKRVSVWNDQGQLVGSDNTSHDAGLYVINSLPAGEYFVITDASDYFDELYDDLPCNGIQHPGCDPLTGAPVTVQLNTATSGIDFALEFAGRAIQGAVKEGASGRPIPNAAVDLWDASGTRITGAVTGGAGLYQFMPGSASGPYFISTDTGLDFVDQVYKAIPCPSGPAFAGLCDPVAGTPISLPDDGPPLTGIDFELLQPDTVFATGFE